MKIKLSNAVKLGFLFLVLSLGICLAMGIIMWLFEILLNFKNQ